MSSNRVIHDGSVTNEEKEITSGPSSRRQTNKVLPRAYKVGVSPKQNLFEEFKCTVKETFFPDEPLRLFKNQTRSRKFLMALEAIFPILQWGREYSLDKFKGDLIAGLTIASLCIPQVIFHFYFVFFFFF